MNLEEGGTRHYSGGKTLHLDHRSEGNHLLLLTVKQPNLPRVPGAYLRPVLDLVDGELHRNVEAVQDVAPEHQSVLRRVDGVDPAWRAEIKEL